MSQERGRYGPKWRDAVMRPSPRGGTSVKVPKDGSLAYELVPGPDGSTVIGDSLPFSSKVVPSSEDTSTSRLDLTRGDSVRVCEMKVAGKDVHVLRVKKRSTGKEYIVPYTTETRE